MFKTIWTVLRYEASQQARRRAYLFFTIGLPVLALLGFWGYQALAPTDDNPGEVTPFEDVGPVGYVDHSGLLSAPQTEPFLGKIRAYPDETAAQDALQAGEVRAYYVVPVDYLHQGQVERVSVRFDLSAEDTGLFEAFVVNHLLQAAEGQPEAAQLYLRFQQPVVLEQNLITAGGEATRVDQDVNFLKVYVFAIAFVLTVFTVSRYLMQSVVEERETRMVEIILSSTRPAPLLMGKILASGSLGLIQMAALLGTAAYILTRLGDVLPNLVQIEVSATVLLLNGVYFVGGYLLLGALFAGVGAISESMREGPQLATFFTLPAIAPLWVTFLFAEDPNGTVPVILSLFPLTAPLSMIMRVAVTSVPAWQVGLSLALLAVAIVGAMWFAGRLFRVRTLLSGSRPRLRDLPGLLLSD